MIPSQNKSAKIKIDPKVLDYIRMIPSQNSRNLIKLERHVLDYIRMIPSQNMRMRWRCVCVWRFRLHKNDTKPKLPDKMLHPL